SCSVPLASTRSLLSRSARAFSTAVGIGLSFLGSFASLLLETPLSSGARGERRASPLPPFRPEPPTPPTLRTTSPGSAIRPSVADGGAQRQQALVHCLVLAQVPRPASLLVGVVGSAVSDGQAEQARTGHRGGRRHAHPHAARRNVVHHRRVRPAAVGLLGQT